jgi:capsular exopolysaccharide synthesis family protein
LPRETGTTAVYERGQSPVSYSSAADYEAPISDGAEFDLRKYWRLFLKHRWLFIVAATLGLGVGGVRTLLTTPIYQASTTIQINRTIPNVSGVQGSEDVSDVEGGRNDEFYQTQYELLQSRSLAERVVKALNLQDNSTFITSTVRSPLANLRRLVFGAGLQDQSGSTAPDITARQDTAVGRVMGGLSVQPVRDSTIVKVSFNNPNPDLAQQVANGVASAFIQENLDRRYGAATYARQFLEEHLAELKQKLEASEKQLVAYADANDIVSPTEGQTLAQPDLQAANDALTKASSDRLRLQLLWDQVSKTTGIGIPEVLEDQAIAGLRAKKADLETTYQDKLKVFKPAFPDMQKLKAQMDEIDKQIAAEVELIKASIKSQYDTAVANEQALTQQVESLKGDVTDFRNVNIQYTILKREVDTNRTLYEGLLQRYKDVGVAGGVGTNNVSIVDRATGASMVAPNLKKNLVTWLAIALLLAAAGAFAREQFDDTFKSPDELEEGLGLPLLGIIPASRSEEEHAKALTKPQSAVSEAYRSLRTALQFSTSAGVPKTLLVTSSRAGEGKSTTSIMLARHYAQVGMKVLLVDGDLRKPTLHRYFKVDRSVGLTNCLSGQAVPAGLFQKTDQEGLTLLPSGPLPPNPAELIAGPKMAALLTTVAETFDLVIIDGPPIAGLADAPLLSSLSEGTLLVIDGTATRRNVVKAGLKRLLLARAQVVGVAVNRLDIRRSGYGYDYGYDDDYYAYPGPRGQAKKKRDQQQGPVAIG